MWVILVTSLAQQGLLGSNQEEGFGQGQCVVANANTGRNFATRHNHNTRCTAGLGINEYRIGDDTFISRHLDYLVAYRNGTCISNAPADTRCEHLHLYRTELTPFLAIMETSWKKYTGGPIPESPSLRHQSNYQNLTQMDEMSRYVAQTLNFGPYQDFPKFPLSKQVGNDTYFFNLNVFVEPVPSSIKYSPFRRYNDGVQYTLDNQDEIMAGISSADGSAYTRKGSTGEQNNFGLHTPHSYVSTTSNPDILSGIVLAHPLEVILSDGLENVSNTDILNCGGVNLDIDNGGTMSPIIDKHRFWVMESKACTSGKINSTMLSFEIISFLLAAVVILVLLLRRKSTLPSPTKLRAGVCTVLAFGLIVIFSTPSFFREFGKDYGVFSEAVCDTPDDYEFEACNSAYAYRCYLTQVLAGLILLSAIVVAAAEIGALYNKFDWRSQTPLLVIIAASAIICLHFYRLIYSMPSDQSDCGRFHTASQLWGLWAFSTIYLVYIGLTIEIFVSLKIQENGKTPIYKRQQPGL